MSFISQFGASLLLGPMCIALALWQRFTGNRHDARLWPMCIILVVLTTAALKVYFSACSIHLFNVHSISGHAAFSAIAYGGISVVTFASSRRYWAIAGRIVVAAWVLMIGASRVVVGAHTTAEVIVGLAIGAAGVALFAGRYQSREPRPAVALILAAAAVAVVVADVPVQRFSVEPYLHWLGAQLTPYGRYICL